MPVSVLTNRRGSAARVSMDDSIGLSSATASLSQQRQGGRGGSSSSPAKRHASSLSPVLSSSRLLSSITGDGNSPLQAELKKLNRIASTVAMAVTESHQSDDELNGDDSDDDGTSSGEEEEVIGNMRDDDLAVHPSPAGEQEGSRSPSMMKRLTQPTGISESSDVPVTFLGRLDMIDKRASLPIFMLDLGFLFEIVMLIFGTWFGLPVPSWALWTALIAFIDEYRDDIEIPPFQDETKWKRDISGSLIALAFVLYTISFTRWVRKGKFHSVYANLKQLISVPMLWVVVFYYGTNQNGHNAGGFYCITWVVAEVIGHLLKYWVHRLRPVAYLGESLPRRHFPEVQVMFSKGHTAGESFPSADTTGGAVFAAVFMLLGLIQPVTAVALSLVIAFSRIYLQAHHLFDVGVGFALGWGTTLAMWPLCGQERTYGPGMATLSVLFFVVFSLVARKMKPALPKHMQRQKNMYGF